MEEQDPPIDAMMRGKALQQAIAHFSGSTLRYGDPDEVVAAATKFYQFLKGETK